ncbi:MAG: hypothetical protein JWP29_184, partial [Rhodoferax sp.]|nr:hypothetical protein [Rhodoferax sp.]
MKLSFRDVLDALRRTRYAAPLIVLALLAMMILPLPPSVLD